MATDPTATQNHSYDAIVIGTGITGGWAAKELTEKGLKTLVLDRGRDVKHGDYPTATKDIWEFPYGGRATDEDLQNAILRFADLPKQRIRLANWSGRSGAAPDHLSSLKTRFA